MTPRAAALRTSLALFALYLLTGSGGLFTPDDVAIYRVAASLARGEAGEGWSADPAGIEGWGARGADGRFYPQFAPLQSVLLVPFVLVERAAGVPDAFLCSYLHAFTTAAVVGMFILLLTDLGAAPVTAAAGGVLLGAATPLWPYATYSFSEPLAALGLLVAVRSALRSRGAAAVAAGALAGAGLAFAALARQEVLVAFPAVWIALVAHDRRAAAAGIAVSLAGPALLVAHNFVRFGGILATGHETGPGAWSLAQIPLGLAGNLVAPGKGLAWFAPAVLAAAAGLPFLYRRRRAAVLLAAGVVLPVVLVGAAWHSWMGGYSWGPRRFVPVLPVIFIAIAEEIAIARRKRAAAAAVIALALVGAAVNAAGIGAHFAAVLVAAEPTGPARFDHPLVPKRDFHAETLWSPRFSPIVDHARLVAAGEGRLPVLARLGPAGGAGALIIGLFGVIAIVPTVRSSHTEAPPPPL